MIKNQGENIYNMKCFGCNGIKDLTLVAHRRHEKESINGWIVLCDNCFDKYSDKQLVLADDIDDKVDSYPCKPDIFEQTYEEVN